MREYLIILNYILIFFLYSTNVVTCNNSDGILNLMSFFSKIGGSKDKIGIPNVVTNC